MKLNSLLAITALWGLTLLAGSAFAQTWTQTSAPITNWTSIACSADGSKLLAAAGGFSGNAGPVYLSTNSAATWTPASVPITNWSSVASSADGSKLVAAAFPGPIYTSADSGITWTQTSAPIKYWRAVASSADGTKLAAGGDPFTFSYTSTTGGETWTQVIAFDFGEMESSIASSADGTRLFAGGCVCQIAHPGRIYTSADSGATWAPTSVYVYNPSIAASADGTKVLIADGGSIFASTNSGATWTTTNIGVQLASSSADGARWMALGGGYMYFSTNLASTWTQTTAPTNVDWKAMASSADGSKLVAAAYDGGIYCWHFTPMPALDIMRRGSNVFLSWTVPSLSFVLQENSDLTTTNWTDVPDTPALSFTNVQNQVALPQPTGNRFYRLKY